MELLPEVQGEGGRMKRAIRWVPERSLTKPNVLSMTCPACGMSNSVAWGSMDLPPFRQAVAMLADSWNSR